MHENIRGEQDFQPPIYVDSMRCHNCFIYWQTKKTTRKIRIVLLSINELYAYKKTEETA